MVNNAYLSQWIEEVRELCQPDRVQIIDGSEEENSQLNQKLVESKTFIPLSRENSFLARTNPDDVARVEERTFICSERAEDAGPTNNWKNPKEMKGLLRKLFEGCMRGRTMYVVPYCMGPLHSPWSRISVEITDSAYVVVNLRIMAKIGTPALEALGKNPFVKCLHSVGKPLMPFDTDVPWPCNPKDTYIVHFPESREVWSFGSGYGGNALLNKKSFALRIATTMARKEGWMAEHMLTIGVTNPQGEKKYFAAAFPSACGKTNLALMTPSLPGWKVECIGDDISWMHWGKDGRLYSINPESGFFGVAPGTSEKTVPHAMEAISKNSIFTNVALTDDNDIWWEGLTKTPPKHLIDWKGRDWTPESKEKAAHPNARFTAPLTQSSSLDPMYNNPEGVPISGIIFGGRRSTTIPLVREAMSWQQGVFMGAAMTSETTAAAKGVVGAVRHDPFAMLPFCGYNMADYFADWLKQEAGGRIMPKIFYVNWFLKDEKGEFLWPGFGDNIRVISWMFDRVNGGEDARKTPVGFLPTERAFGASEKLFTVDPKQWKAEVEEMEKYFQIFGNHFPKALQEELQSVKRAFP